MHLRRPRPDKRQSVHGRRRQVRDDGVSRIRGYRGPHTQFVQFSSGERAVLWRARIHAASDANHQPARHRVGELPRVEAELVEVASVDKTATERLGDCYELEHPRMVPQATRSLTLLGRFCGGRHAVTDVDEWARGRATGARDGTRAPGLKARADTADGSLPGPRRSTGVRPRRATAARATAARAGRAPATRAGRAPRARRRADRRDPQCRPRGARCCRAPRARFRAPRRASSPTGSR